MAIRFRCDGCGKPFEVRDDLAGKTAQCKQCGGRMQIPKLPEQDPDLDVYGLSDPGPDPFAAQSDSAEPTRGNGGWATRPSSDPAPARASVGSYYGGSTAPAKKSFFGENGLKGALGTLLVIGVIGLKVYFRANRNFRPRNPRPADARAGMLPARAFNLDGPIAEPRFPDPGTGREIQPGITVREVTLGMAPGEATAGKPGYVGKIWIYTPAGDHPPGSLPCVLVAPAGSNLITGMIQADGDRDEHLPYAKAGFAVVAYELDGYPGELQGATDEEMNRAAVKFLHARAGLVNAHIALEYALAKLPEIDPNRIAAAGHSSAGTMAVLFAEHEPRLRACVAFAPALNLAERFGPQAVTALEKAGLGALVNRFSPSGGISTLHCPLFLFHARDDSNVPVGQSEQFAADVRAQGKPVTLDVVPAGDHYESMIREGIPNAIEWLRKTLGPGSGANAPEPG